MKNTNFTDEKIREWLKENLSENRFIHSLGTEETAGELALKFGLDVEKAKLTGLIHDCAKCMPNHQMVEIIKTQIHDLDITKFVNYKTYHAPVGAYLARKIFAIDDNEILSAISCHTLGRVGMNDFEKIIFLADKIEKNTREIEYREKILTLLDEKNLDCALLVCFEDTIKSLVNRRLKICQQTIDVYNELLNKCEE